MADLRSFGSPANGAGTGQRHAWAAANGNGSGAGVILPFVKPAAAATGYKAETRHCPMLAVDIKAFNHPERGEDVQRFLRAAMYDLLAGAFDGSCVQWSACHREDRGDGVLVVAPQGTPETALIDPLVDHLRAGLRRHNKLCSDLAAIRLRMAVHAGQVHFDQNGISGYAVTHLFRMLEAAAFKRAFAASDADFALVASAALYEDVISRGPGLIDPDMYAPINIRCKETRARAWLYLPPVRNPFLHSVSSSRTGRHVGRQGHWPFGTSAPASGPRILRARGHGTSGRVGTIARHRTYAIAYSYPRHAPPPARTAVRASPSGGRGVRTRRALCGSAGERRGVRTRTAGRLRGRGGKRLRTPRAAREPTGKRKRVRTRTAHREPGREPPKLARQRSRQRLNASQIPRPPSSRPAFPACLSEVAAVCVINQVRLPRRPRHGRRRALPPGP